MLITWSRHGRTPIDSSNDVIGATGYPAAPAWTKSVGSETVLVCRDPVPELIMGSAIATQQAIAAIPRRQTHKYVSCVMSFSASDVDVVAFNAGDTHRRSAVDTALRMFLELIFAGLAPAYRPAHFVTTHTHTGRLEVNILIACSVFDPVRRKFYSFNPNPDREGYRVAYRALQNVLNARFSWADPSDPRLRRRLKAPH